MKEQNEKTIKDISKEIVEAVNKENSIYDSIERIEEYIVENLELINSSVEPETNSA